MANIREWIPVVWYDRVAVFYAVIHVVFKTARGTRVHEDVDFDSIFFPVVYLFTMEKKGETNWIDCDSIFSPLLHGRRGRRKSTVACY